MELNFEYTDYPFDGSQLCNETNSELFFPDEYTDVMAVEKARTICRSCPLINECIAYAIEIPSLEGIWGGTTPRQRIRMRSNRKKKLVNA
jgi:WhiB family transcriptional regulator, redox-sensing transcriptional regulator